MNKKKSILLIIVFILLILVIIVAIYFVKRNTNESVNNQLSEVEGTWIADQTQYVYIIGYENGQPVYSNTDTPFYLTLDGKGNYKLEMSDIVENGTYSFNDNNLVLQNDEGLITENCQVVDKKELHCDKYASVYVKQ